MAEINPPFALQNAGSTHTAANDRMAIGALLAGQQTSSPGGLIARGGVAPALGTAMAVTPSSGLTLAIGSGVAFVSGNSSATQGVYICTNDASVSITLDTAHGTLPRIDNIICRVYDSVYSGTTNLWAIEKVTGTAASSPVAPNNPPNSITLARVTVAAAATTIASGDISDARNFIDQGVIPCKSTNKPSLSSVADGQLLSLTDTGEIQMKISGAFVTKSSQSSIPNIQVFTASGTWTKPANAKTCFVEVIGGGGAGGGAAATGAGQSSVGSGGGAGGYAAGWIDASTLGSTVTVTVGAGGTGASGTDGNNGSGSSFGSSITASGGSGGSMRSASTTPFGMSGGTGGATFTGGNYTIPGGDGGACWGDGQLGISGDGGSSRMSGSVAGVRTNTTGQRLAGTAGKRYGGGGSGACNSGSVAAIAGGAGSAGGVIVTTYF